MNKLILIICTILLFAGCKQQKTSTTTVAFGSCSDQNSKQQLWSEINAANPDIFVFLGDNIYGDSYNYDTLKAAYEKQKSNSELQKLFNSTPVIGTWDDHDYGVNDGGKNYSLKDSSKLLFMDFLNFETSDEVMSHDGVYNSHLLKSGERTIKFLMLDTRYFRDTLVSDTTSNHRYIPNNEGTILGEQQWQWLENELGNNEADITIIGSSIQVLSNTHPFEKWANFPKERKRLLQLLEDYKNTFIISGDRHIAELSKYKYKNGNQLFDFTASGLTHTWSEIGDESNEYRVDELIINKNYGLIEFNWDSNEVTFKVMGEENKALLNQVFPLD